jgi:hypothetical protein
MWAMLQDLADQVFWHGQQLTKEEWKWVMTAAVKKQKLVPGVDGGLVVIGDQTSRKTKEEMSELMEFIAYFGTEHNVHFGGDE